jgi:cytochrome b
MNEFAYALEINHAYMVTDFVVGGVFAAIAALLLWNAFRARDEDAQIGFTVCCVLALIVCCGVLSFGSYRYMAPNAQAAEWCLDAEEDRATAIALAEVAANHE